MFVLDEKVVYPGHGVAKISRIFEKVISGVVTQFFELKFLNKDMTILVPVDNLEIVGVRRLSSLDNVNDIFKMLAEPFDMVHSESAPSNWNKRNKEYQGKLRTGNLYDISKIYRDLRHISSYKELSFGEKALLQQTELLLAQEISLVKRVGEDTMIEQLRAMFAPVVYSAVQSSTSQFHS